MARPDTWNEVKSLRRERGALNEVVAELTFRDPPAQNTANTDGRSVKNFET